MTQANYQILRETMVSNQLRTAAVSDPAVVAAMKAVPREAFVPAGRVSLAYADTALPLGGGRALNPPMATGRLLTALDARPGERALVVGAATGYAAALLAEMGLTVTALEDDAALADIARGALKGVTLVSGPLAEGWAKGAPYDVILVDGAIEHVPDALKAQLAEGGRMAAGLVERGVTRLAAGRKVGDALVLADFADVDTVILPGFALPRAFVF